MLTAWTVAGWVGLGLGFGLGAPEAGTEARTQAGTEAGTQAGTEPAPARLDRSRTVELGGPSPGHRPADDVARVHALAPRAALRAVGGLGRFTAVGLRPPGATLFKDGAPVSLGVAGMAELEALVLDERARVDIYRGEVPIGYGAAVEGQALDFVGQVHRGPAKLWFVAGFGSYVTREARVGFAAAVDPHTSIAGRVGYLGSYGDFAYFDDVGTPYLFGDDGHRRRASNRYDAGHAELRLDHDHGPGGLIASTSIHGAWRIQDVPMRAGALVSGAGSRQFSLRSISRLRKDLGPRAEGAYVEWVASVAGEGRRYVDPEASLGGVADDERALGFDAWLSPRMRLAAWRQAWFSVSAELRGEVVDIRERHSDLDPAMLSSGDARRGRFSAGLGLGLEQWLYDRRWSVSPSLHLDLIASRFAVAEGEGEIRDGLVGELDAGRDSAVLGVSPRLATAFTLVRALVLRGSLGRYLRPPTTFELFGDRGYIRANEGLRVESGTRVDGGLSYAVDRPGGLPVSVTTDLIGFATWSRDMIQWVRDEDGAAHALNLARVRQRGLELGASVRAFSGDLGLDLAYVLLDSQNADASFAGRVVPIPGRPRHDLSVRPIGGHRFVTRRRAIALEPRAYYELAGLSASTTDVEGRAQLPARWLHGLGVSLRIADQVELAVEAHNLGGTSFAVVNQGGRWPGPYPVASSDRLGFPLPGRSLWFQIRVDVQPDLGRREGRGQGH